VKRTIASIFTASLLAATAFAVPPAPAPPTTKPTAFPSAAALAAAISKTSTPQPATAPAPLINRAAVLNGLVLNGPGNNLLEAQRRGIRVQQQQYEAQPIVATYRLEDLIKFSLADGMLRADVASRDLPFGLSRFAVEGSSAIWIARSTPNAGFPTRYVNVHQYNFDQTDEGQIWRTELTCSDSYLTLNSYGVGFTLSYAQSNGMVMLTAMRIENGRYRQLLRLDAPSLLRLQSEHPEEVREYLKPMLKRWTNQDLLSPGATDVYIVFGELPPPSDAAGKLAALLPALDSELFSERDAASKELAKLGRPGIQAALRLDHGALSFEQNDRIDAFIDRQRHRLIDDPQSFRHDESFLMDCLTDEDPAIRAAAKMELEKLLGRPVTVDISADSPKRLAAVDELRNALKQERDAKAATHAN
jgi:hypothetical protein